MKLFEQSDNLFASKASETMPRTMQCLVAILILIMAIDVCESRIRFRVRSRVRVGSGGGGGGTGGFSWSAFGVVMATIVGSIIGTIIIMAILSYCCYIIISTLEVSEIEKELPGNHVNETVINMEPPNQFEDINGVSQTVGPGSPAIPLPYIV